MGLTSDKKLFQALNSSRKRVYFNETWRGKSGHELEKTSGIIGALAVNKAGNYAVANGWQAAFEMVKKVFHKIMKYNI